MVRTHAEHRRVWIAAFLGVSAAIVVTAAWLLARSAAAVREQAYEHLETVGALKAAYLEQWRWERRGDATTLAQNTDVVRAAVAASASPGRPHLPRDLVEAFVQTAGSSAGAYDYTNVLLFNSRGRLAARLRTPGADVGPTTDTAVVAALKSTDVVLSNLYRGTDDQVRVDIVQAVRSGNLVVGALALRITAERHIYPLLRAWPTTRETAESILLRGNGDSVSVLNGRRDSTSEPIAYGIPMTRADAVAIQAVRGTRGRATGVNHFGQPVIADLREVAGAQWLLSTETLRSVVDGAARQQAALILAMATLAVLFVAAGAAFAHSRQRTAALLAQIDAERAAQDASRRTTDSFLNIFDVAPVMVILTELDSGRIRAANAETVRLSGLSRDALIGRTTVELGWLEPDRRERLVAVIRGGHGVRGEPMSIPAAKGGRRSMRFWSNALTIGTERVLITIAFDETQRLAVEEAVRASEARFHAVVDNTDDGVTFCDENGLISYRSSAYERILGYTAEQRIGRSAFELVHPDDVHIARDLLRVAAANPGTRHEARFRGRHEDGHYLTLDALAVSMLDVPAVRAIVVTIRDVSDRVRAEEERKQVYEMLVHAQRQEAVGQLAGGVAHDFNNILTAMMFDLGDLAGMADVPVVVRTAVTDLTREVERAAALTRQLLLFGRRQQAVMKPVELNALVGNLLRMLNRLIGEQVTIAFTGNAPDAWLFADNGMIEQVVTNLVVNARDAMPGGGRVTISTDWRDVSAEVAARYPGAHAGRFVCLSVTDTGSGMTAEVANHAFEPFFTTKPVGQGTGLGLATVAAIVAQHGGWSAVESQPERGTTVRIFLPESEGVGEHAELPRFSDVLRGSEHVLIVEDDASVRQAIVRMVEAAGYAVTMASDVSEAVERFHGAARPVDLLLTDLVMPGASSGWDLIEQLHAEQPALRVILMSGYSHTQLDAERLNRHKVFFLAKPLDPRALMQSLRQVLDAG